MDGLQATREIRARFQAATRPRIVAMTANASTSDRDDCFAAGMDDFLTKPVRSADLRKAILATPTRYVASAA
jgi:CheY-like chemotaxis protein